MDNKTVGSIRNIIAHKNVHFKINFLNNILIEEIPTWIINRNYLLIGKDLSSRKDEIFKFSDLIEKDDNSYYCAINVGIGILLTLRRLCVDEKKTIFVIMDDSNKESIELIERIKDVIKDAAPIVEENCDFSTFFVNKNDVLCGVDNELLKRLINFYIVEYNLDNNYSPLTINSIEVDKLFGCYSYKLDFANSNDLISLIYGSNGIGKTTLFKIIESLIIPPSNNDLNHIELKKKLHVLQITPFEKIEINTSYNYNIVATNYRPYDNIPLVHLEIRYENTVLCSFEPTLFLNMEYFEKKDFNLINEEAIAHINDYYKAIRKYFPKLFFYDKFLFIKTNRFNNSNEFNNLIDDFEKENDPQQKLLSVVYDIKKYILGKEKNTFFEGFYSLLDNAASIIIQNYYFIEVSVIEDIDILKPSKAKPIDWIKPEDVMNIWCKYNEKVYFICDLVKNKQNDDDFEIYKQLDDLNEEYFVKIIICSFVIFKLYYDGFWKEFSLFGPYLSWKKIHFDKSVIRFFEKYKLLKECFEGFYNEYNPARKILNYKNGSIVINSFNDPDNDLTLNCLSSGELNILTILYNLIFNSNSESIVLIDEPEVSLHTAWQMQFTDIIKKIKEKIGFAQIIVASHSPFITSGHDEYIVIPEFKEEENNE